MESANVNKTGGNFDPDVGQMYFIAANVDRLIHSNHCHKNILVAVNELNSSKDINYLHNWIDEKYNVFIDSGVYFLTMEHARRHGVSMDKALSIPPTDLDGFDALFDRYLSIIEPVKETCWGYIEIDAGGREEKIKTRARLEALGLRPIPVYHPLNDGWDYFDYLAQHYDRICFGNVVQAERQLRKRLCATLWERRQKCPNLWVHLLGLTPDALLSAYSTNSTDSSSWLSGVRWDGCAETTMGQTIGRCQTNYQYQLSSIPDTDVGNRKATAMSASIAHMLELNWNNHINRLTQLGIYER